MLDKQAADRLKDEEEARRRQQMIAAQQAELVCSSITLLGPEKKATGVVEAELSAAVLGVVAAEHEKGLDFEGQPDEPDGLRLLVQPVECGSREVPQRAVGVPGVSTVV